MPPGNPVYGTECSQPEQLPAAPGLTLNHSSHRWTDICRPHTHTLTGRKHTVGPFYGRGICFREGDMVYPKSAKRDHSYISLLLHGSTGPLFHTLLLKNTQAPLYSIFPWITQVSKSHSMEAIGVPLAIVNNHMQLTKNSRFPRAKFPCTCRVWIRPSCPTKQVPQHSTDLRWLATVPLKAEENA